MQNKIRISLIAIAAMLAGTFTAFAKSDKAATKMESLIWANGLIYDTVVTGASFKMPPGHSLDIFYAFVDLEGQRPISDAAPGDSNYNGGRWWVHEVSLTELGQLHFGGGAMELTSAAMVLEGEDMGYFVISPTENFFSCPLVGKGKAVE